MKDRFQIIGASEVAGLLKEYAHTLVENDIINEEVFYKLQEMPSYLETRYSLARKLMLDKEQFRKFNEFNTNEAMIRGSECEELVKDDFIAKDTEIVEVDDITHTSKCYVIESQTMKEKIIVGCEFPFRATIDYILSDNSILECKTTDISQWFKIENKGLPYNYYIQAQAQLWLHEKETCYIHIAGIQTNKDNDLIKYNLLESKTFTIKRDESIIKAIQSSLVWFSLEFESGDLLDKKDEDKTKKDRQIDEFLQIEKGTIEIAIDSILSAKLSKLKELELAKKEYDRLDKEIKEQVKSMMAGYCIGKFKSNEFKIEAKYSKESYHDEESIAEALEKAKSINIGDIKVAKRLTVKY